LLSKIYRLILGNRDLIQVRKMQTLLLTDVEVKSLLSMAEVMEVVEVAFNQKGFGRVQMPAKSYLHYKKYNGDLRTMPSYLEELDISAVKIVNVHPDNPLKNSLPTVMGVVVLVDPATGYPIAIMGGTAVTCMRTGAAGGVAAKYLARKNSKVVGFVGAGTQARSQLAGLLEVFKKFEEIRVYDKNREAQLRFITETKANNLNVSKIVASESVKETTLGADIVVTATPSREPIVMNNMISPGTHITCIGADAVGKEELDPALLKRAKIVIDDWEQASHSGEINVPLSHGMLTKGNVWAEIGEIVAGLKPGRKTDDEITVFASTGLAIQDAVTAKLAYKKALQKNIGTFTKIV
jgi:alanine dehydrogenase